MKKLKKLNYIQNLNLYISRMLESNYEEVEESTKHHLEITILTGAEHNLETTAVLDGVEVKHITPASVQEAKLLTFPNLEEIPFTEFPSTFNKIIMMEGLGYVTENGQYLMAQQNFGEMPWIFVNSKNPEDSISISAQDVGLKSASGYVEIAPDQSSVKYIFDYE